MRSAIDLHFQILSTTHMAILAGVPAAAAFMIWWAKRHPEGISVVRYGLGGLLFAASVGWHLYCLLRGWIVFPHNLPITICDFSLVLSAFALLTARVWAYEFAYYNAVGALVALLTPDLWEPFPSPSTIQFFVGHCGIVTAVLFLTCTGTLRPREGSAWRVFLAVNALVLLAVGFDLFFGTNYLYLRAKPSTATLLTYLGPWPLYLLVCEALMLLIFKLMELPFRVAGRRPARTSHAINPFLGNSSGLLGIRLPEARD
jgi:hypothetical integral membrane protein (TIGR02206 family)